jgi:hypothetical protein
LFIISSHLLRTRETDATGPNVSRVVTSMSGVQSASTVGCKWERVCASQKEMDQTSNGASNNRSAFRKQK